MTAPQGYDHRDGKGWSWLESWAEDLAREGRPPGNDLERLAYVVGVLHGRLERLQDRVRELERLREGTWP